MNQHLFEVHKIVPAIKKNYEVKPGKGQQQISFASSSGTRNQFSQSFIEKTGLTLNEDLLMWLVMDTLPFASVSKDGFQYFCARQMPYRQLPSESTLHVTTLPKVYSEVKSIVKKLILEASTLCLMFDGWSDRHNACHFLGIRAAFISDDWKPHVVTLSCKPCPQDSQGMADHIVSELEDFGLTDELLASKRIFTTHDGAAAMIKTSRILHSQYTQVCCCHALHLLIMTDGLNKIPALNDLLTRCKNMVMKLHFKGNIVEELSKVLKLQQISELLEKVETACLTVSNDINMPIEERMTQTRVVIVIRN